MPHEISDVRKASGFQWLPNHVRQRLSTLGVDEPDSLELLTDENVAEIKGWLNPTDLERFEVVLDGATSNTTIVMPSERPTAALKEIMDTPPTSPANPHQAKRRLQTGPTRIDSKVYVEDTHTKDNGFSSVVMGAKDDNKRKVSPPSNNALNAMLGLVAIIIAGAAFFVVSSSDSDEPPEAAMNSSLAS
jgi:hypothetical protein